MDKKTIAKRMKAPESHAYKVKKGGKAFRHALKKGYESLESVGRNEGEKHYLGKDEQAVA